MIVGFRVVEVFGGSFERSKGSVEETEVFRSGAENSSPVLLTKNGPLRTMHSTP